MSGANDRRNSASSATAVGEVVGDDSMVVGKGIMIKGDVDNCAVSERRTVLLSAVLFYACHNVSRVVETPTALW